MKTRAAVLRSTEEPISIEELTIPTLQVGQVLVKVAYSGICHTQLSEIRGLRGVDRFLPHTLGHEGSGVVVEVGPNVKKVTADDHVVISWIKGPGADVPSTQYIGNDGTVNSGAVSTFMEYAVISENRLTVIPKDMPMKEAALLGCAVPTGAGAILNSGAVRPGSSVVIYGIGGIGLCAVMGAVLCNAGTIIAVDIHDQKLSLAKELGATHVINATNQDVLSRILEITGNKGVDCAFEAVGLRQTMETAFSCVRDSGGLAILAGNPSYGEKITINPYDLIKGKRLLGTWGGETVPDRDILMYVKFFMEGKLPLSKMISHIYKLQEINEAVNYLEKGEARRILLEL